MARTKMTVRIESDQRRLAMQRTVASPRQVPVRAPRIRVKNIEGRIRNRTFKIKKLLAQQKVVEVKKNVCVVCRMAVRRSTVYQTEVRTHY